MDTVTTDALVCVLHATSHTSCNTTAGLLSDADTHNIKTRSTQGLWCMLCVGIALGQFQHLASVDEWEVTQNRVM